jgi:xylose isomerase
MKQSGVSGEGKKFDEGKLTLEDLVAYAKKNGESEMISGKQELYESNSEYVRLKI